MDTFIDPQVGPNRDFQRHVLGSRPKVRGAEHTGDANRHFSKLKPYMCICLEPCCQDEEYGCKCKVCPCRNGGPSHDQAHDIHNAERKRIADAQEAIYTRNAAQEIVEAHSKAATK